MSAGFGLMATGVVAFPDTVLRVMSYAVIYTIIFASAVVFLGAVGVTFAVIVAITLAVTGILGGGLEAVVVGILAVVVGREVAKGFGTAGTIGIAGTLSVLVITTIAIAVVGLSAYIAWRTMKGDQRDAWIRKIAISVAATGGTSFYKADLTDAIFTQAQLKNTDLRARSLIRTCWQGADQLDQVRVGKTLLDQPAVRNLLITKDGYKKSYVAANLEGANLAGVNLESANLKQSNLNQANLRDANLNDANLAQTLAVGTNFTGAYLTGACLEAWTINETTILSNVDCQYVFFLEYPNHLGSRERRPHDPDQVFQPGDFEKLYQEIINTVQILLRDGVNRESFAAAFQKVMAEFPEITPDSVQGMEKRGDDVLVTIAVEPDADKGKLEHTFTQTYEARLEAAKNAALLEAEQRHTQDLKETIAALASYSPSVTITNSNTAESKAMSNSQEKKGIFAENVGGNFNVSNVNLNLDNVNSTVTNSIDELPNTDSETDQPNLKELLTQLQSAINEEANLSEDDKAEALNQVQTLAEAGQNPKASENQTLAKRATTMLKGIKEGLPSAAKLAEECNKLLPAIQALLGL